ncbi:hypothetical protein GOQ29_02200 [Clostridium sp. D2Q-14]|uniref:hypothetical protein n=1 Tax=Anaeromonas gelatinilytica TaxID=2683194 RepID=UPI00193B22B2|nr:hypothetical protein [Anaeromonas gelatinilytica]MBS4534423.1 hypothetical protein [Anaeromonas gelatinilytica]
MLNTILGIIFFAIATMIIYSWGYVKEQKAPYELNRKLNSKAEKKILEELKTHDSMTKKEISKILVGMSVSNFGSRKRLVVQEPNKLAKIVLDNMIKKEIVETDYSSKGNVFILKKD